MSARPSQTADFGVTVATPTCGNPCVSSTSASSAPDCLVAVKAAWAASWSRLLAEYHDAEARLADLEHAEPTRFRAIERLAGAAGREGGRVVRGGGSATELDARLRQWERAVADALAGMDHAKSLRLCADCGEADTDTVLPGLTGGRVCARCLRGQMSTIFPTSHVVPRQGPSPAERSLPRELRAGYSAGCEVGFSASPSGPESLPAGVSFPPGLLGGDALFCTPREPCSRCGCATWREAHWSDGRLICTACWQSRQPVQGELFGRKDV